MLSNAVGHVGQNSSDHMASSVDAIWTLLVIVRFSLAISVCAMLSIDFIQHQNPFHGGFTHKTARFWYAKLVNI